MRTNTITDNFSLRFIKANKQENDSVKKENSETIYFDINTKVIKNAIIITGKSDRTNFNVICNYSEEVSLLKDGFYYTFIYNDCKASQLQLGWNDTVGGQQEKGLKELNLQRFHIKPKEVHTVPFTDEEIVFLNKPENLKKLESELKKQGFN